MFGLFSKKELDRDRAKEIFLGIKQDADLFSGVPETEILKKLGNFIPEKYFSKSDESWVIFEPGHPNELINSPYISSVSKGTGDGSMITVVFIEGFAGLTIWISDNDPSNWILKIEQPPFEKMGIHAKAMANYLSETHGVTTTSQLGL